MAPERRRQVLMGLLAVLVLFGGWRYLGAPAPDGPSAVAAATRRADQPGGVVPPVDVRLDALEAARVAPEDAARNPFAFGAREPVAGATGRRPVSASPAAPLTPVVEVPRVAPLPPIPFKFIGLVEGAASARRIAVLSDSKGLVVHGAEGAIIDGQFRILSIGPESVEIAYADGRGRQTLRLSGQ